MQIKLKLITFLPLSLLSHIVSADVIVGPGAVSGPISVTIDPTFIVGSTTVTSTGTNAGANVTGSLLTLDSLLGPSPGQVIIQTLNGNALNANGGSISASNNVLLNTVGGHGVLANGGTSNATLTNTSIQTTGTGAGLVAIGGTISATGVTINNLGNSTVNVSAGHGAIAESGGTVTLNAGTSIATGAFNAVGLGASGAGSQVITTAVIPVVMNGRGAMGVYLHDGGQVNLVNGTTLQLNASNSVGVAVDNTTVALGTLGQGLTLNFNAVPSSGQAGGTGVVAINGGNVSLENLTVQGVGAGAGAWAQPGGTINLTGASLININSNANPTFYTLATPYLATAAGQVGSIFSVTSGLPIGGLLSKGGTINSTGTTINVSSNNGVGAYAAASTISTVNMFNNIINTTGNSSFGIEAGENGRITGSNTNVTSTGGGAGLFLFAFNGYGSIDLSNSHVEALGANTTGLASLNLSANLTNMATLNNTFLTSAEDAVVLAVGGPLSVSATQSILTAQNGLLIDSIFNAGAAQQSVVSLLSSQSTLSGDAHADSQSIVNMNLTNASFWSGASLDATNITVDPSSVWSVTANSNITQQLINGGLVSFTPPIPTFKTVTTQNYLGNGGTLAINTYLGSDGSPSDTLVINGGTAIGNSFIFVTNTTGPGALTEANGILVVDTINGGTTAPAAFSLSNPGGSVSAGPYAYLLYRGSVDSTNPNAWYLRSTIDCSQSNDPSCSPGQFFIPNYRPQVSLYAAIPSMALFYGQSLLDTLHERVGEEEDLAYYDQRLNNYASGWWARVIGQHGNVEGSSRGVYADGPEYDYNVEIFQLGRDFYRSESEEGNRNHIGLYGATGLAKGSVQHVNNLFAGSNKMYVNTIGGYWTHFTPEGAYLDTVIQESWYRDDSDSALRNFSLETEGTNFAASIEGGYPIDMTEQFFIEPQAQFVYQTMGFDQANDGAATIKFDEINSLIGRLGIRLAYDWLLANNENDSARLITIWLRPNYWYDFKGSPHTLFSSQDGFIPFNSDISGSWVELNGGLSANISSLISFYGNVSYQKRISDSDTYAYNGKVGFRVLW